MVSYLEKLIISGALIACLNPYCSGRWSRTYGNHLQLQNQALVLILIVVEDGLVLAILVAYKAFNDSLNPYCSGRWSRTS